MRRRAVRALCAALVCHAVAASWPALARDAGRTESAPEKKRGAARQKADHDKSARKPAGAPAVAVPAEAPPPPYEPQLARLSELLGALAYLRDLCEDHDGAAWREKMAALLDAEAPSGVRRQKLTAAFNRGFHGYQLTYRSCAANAQTVMTRYLDEAGQLARDVSARYGNP